MAEGAGHALWHGQPCEVLRLSNGDSATVLHQGAQVVSWKAAGRERLFVSAANRWDGHTPVRGGIPVCFPQFNQRGPSTGLPKHGFARQLAWQADAPVVAGDSVAVTLQLHTSAATQVFWPMHFATALQVRLAPGRLQVHLQINNTGEHTWAFTGALHSYLAVDDVAQTSLYGLGGQAEWDALTNTYAQAAAKLRFPSAFDRVYAAPDKPLYLQDGSGGLHITQSPTWANTVVWNPGAAISSQLADMAPDSYRQMLCVEAAQVYEPISLAAGASWQGGQVLTLI